MSTPFPRYDPVVTGLATDHLVREALARLRGGELAEAEARARAILAGHRTHGDALSLMGLIEYERARYEEAAAWHRKAIAAHRREPLFHCNLATTLVARGRLTEALACYERALKLRPDHPEAAAGRAEVLERRGKPARAAAVIAPFIASGRPPARMAVVHARLLRGEKRDEELVAFVEGQLLRDDLPDAQRRALLLLLGRAHDRLDDVDRAFDAYRRGNAIGARPYDVAIAQQKVDTLMRTFAPERWPDLPRADPAAVRGADLPVFIVGMPRSGSTLVEQIIHAHPRARGAGEIPDLAHVIRDMPGRIGSGRHYPACVPDLTAAHLADLANGYLDGLRGRAARGAARIADKSLENYERLGLIAMLFPEGRVIHVRRHPLDLCLSCFLHDLPPTLHPYSTDLRALGLQHRQYERLMAFWRDELGVPMLEVEYERLVADPEAESRRIIAFIGLDWDDACLRFHEAKRDVATISYDQVRQPIYATAVARHARYAKHLGPLKETLGCPSTT
jgi:tetratricopeptide (TPR) repeat protein